MTKYAPILIPTVCRYQHFRECLESLARCTWADKTDVYVIVDYPGQDNHWNGYRKITAFLKQCGDMGFNSLNITYRETNYFFAGKGNLRTMLQTLNGKYDRFIYSEDDNVFSTNFLVYMNKCLEEYKDDPNVIITTGYSYPIQWDVSSGATCLKQNVCAAVWGVGFWMNKYEDFSKSILSGKLLNDIDYTINSKLYTRLIDASLREYIPAALSPWRDGQRIFMNITDIALRAYLAVADKYVVSPVVSKVRNLGFDGSGAYCQTINTNLNGDTAGTYNYSQQPIDENDTFELVLDSKQNDKENRNRLNRFDVRTPAQMRRTRLYLWLMTHFGVWAGKTCAIILFPFDFGLRAFRKVWRTIRR